MNEYQEFGQRAAETSAKGPSAVALEPSTTTTPKEPPIAASASCVSVGASTATRQDESSTTASIREETSTSGDGGTFSLTSADGDDEDTGHEEQLPVTFIGIYDLSPNANALYLSPSVQVCF
jgi:hypothetical protein